MCFAASPIGAWRSSLAALLIAAPSLALAQAAQQVAPPPGEELDPASPLAPLPELGLDWPDPSAAPGEPGAAAATVDAEAEQRYSLTIEGLDAIPSTDIRARFEGLSALEADNDANVAQIDRRAREDAETLAGLLRAAGYYDASVEARVAAQPAAVGDAPARIAVTLIAEPGPLYSFSTINLPGLAAAGQEADMLRRAFPIEPRDAVDAEQVASALATLRAELGRRGYAFAEVGDPEVVVDHETRTATLSLPVAPGGPRRFGTFRVEGERPLFDAEHLAEISRIAPGDTLDAGMIDDLRRALIATGLVSSVQLTPVPGADPATADLAVRIERAPPRTIAGEIGYGTGEGARLELSWQHRNLIRPEGAVTFRGVAGTQEQLLGASLRRGNFRRRDQVLTGQVVAANIEREAYDARTFTLAAGLERQTNIIWQKTWTWSFGGELVASDERDVSLATGQERRRTFFIAAAPTSLAYDGSDDLLNPTRGFRLAGRFSPEASIQGRVFGYARAQIDGSVYQPVTERVVLAGRVRLGSIFGASRDSVAPSRRFYAGGGGSVRGYGYQRIGPRDIDNDPIGGRSLVEFAAEARFRIGNFGIVPFVDAGNIYTSALPRLGGMRYGAGVGVRYHTGFGPIRVDVGTPLNPRPGDSRVAVYVSLGQAF